LKPCGEDVFRDLTLIEKATSIHGFWEAVAHDVLNCRHVGRWLLTRRTLRLLPGRRFNEVRCI
jgi:hypothetical protein